MKLFCVSIKKAAIAHCQLGTLLIFCFIRQLEWSFWGVVVVVVLGVVDVVVDLRGVSFSSSSDYELKLMQFPCALRQSLPPAPLITTEQDNQQWSQYRSEPHLGLGNPPPHTLWIEPPPSPPDFDQLCLGVFCPFLWLWWWWRDNLH